MGALKWRASASGAAPPLGGSRMRTRWRLRLCTRPAPVGTLRPTKSPVLRPSGFSPLLPVGIAAVLLLCHLLTSPYTPVAAAITATPPPILLPSPSRTIICRSAPLGVKFNPINVQVTVQSALLLLAASSPGCLGWSLALAFLPVVSAVPQPWYYALHVPKRGYAVFSSWDLSSGHGAIGGSGAIHKKFRSLDAAIEFATLHVPHPIIPLLDVWYPFSHPSTPVPATAAAAAQLKLISHQPPPTTTTLSPPPSPPVSCPSETPFSPPNTHTDTHTPTFTPALRHNTSRKRARSPTPPRRQSTTQPPTPNPALTHSERVRQHNEHLIHTCLDPPPSPQSPSPPQLWPSASLAHPPALITTNTPFNTTANRPRFNCKYLRVTRTPALCDLASMDCYHAPAAPMANCHNPARLSAATRTPLAHPSIAATRTPMPYR